MSGTYDVGDAPAFRHYVRNSDGAPTAATVVFTFVAPDNTTVTPAVTTPALGTYDCTLPVLTQTGPWFVIIDVSGALVDRTTDQFYVADPAPLSYVDLHSVKLATLGADGVSDTTRDPLFLGAIEAAARQIDNTCGRTFTMDRAVSARIFPCAGREYYDRRAGSWTLLVDDIATLTGLIVEVGRGATWTTVAATEYTPTPQDALGKRRPVTGLIRYSPWSGGRGLRPWGGMDVRVTARWGYPAIPAEVTLANQLQASRLQARRKSPEGVTGSAEWGTVRVARVDHDVAALISDHIKQGVGS